MKAYYNEFAAYPAQWLRNLAEAGLITPGHVDERSIEDVRSGELVDYRRAHFFAGIGGWELALKLAGWPEAWPVWTGSCPCQPFSQAGRGRGVKDERHLWPVWYEIIKERRPSIIFGEQVASAAGRLWLNGIRSDMEALGYAFGAADLCAAGVGAPHIRQRLWWVAYSRCSEHMRWDTLRDTEGTAGKSPGQGEGPGPEGQRPIPNASDDSPGSGLPNGNCTRRPKFEGRPGSAGAPGGRKSDSFGWNEHEWINCLDSKGRRIKPEITPLAHGIPRNMGALQPEYKVLAEGSGICNKILDLARESRSGRISAYGNAIVPQVAAEFIKAFMETITET